MDDDKSINAAMWIMIFVQILGNVDPPGKGPRKMPPPRAFIPVIVGFSIIHLMADAGWSRAGKAMAWLTVAAAAVLGPFGQSFASFLKNVSNMVAPPSTNTPGGTP